MIDIIDSLIFNYIITDPPYNIKYKYPDYTDFMTDEEYINLFTKFKLYPTIVIHYPEAMSNYVCKGIGKVNKIIQWCYNNNSSAKAHRSIGFFNCTPNFNIIKQPYKNINDNRIKKQIQKQLDNGIEPEKVGARMYDWINDIQLIKNISNEKCVTFSNQIPIQLLERIIIMTTKEGDTILDPFFGSGSLYFACKNTNRKCIGIEKSIIHLQSFTERLNKAIISNLII